MKNINNRKIKYTLLLMIAAAALVSRLWQFGVIPGDLNQDEAFAGYEAWAIMNYGVDSSLHPYPVYLTAWGSGMNALESYLMMPFIAIFGLRVWVIRLPQLIVGLLSVPAAYSVGKRTAGERGGLLFAFLLAVCPWHILLSRWGLESNLAPGFLLFGLCFFMRGLEKPQYLPLSALMYGLALYTYATIWSVLPFIILLQLVYAAAMGRLRADRWLLLSFVILAVLALPLLLFMLVNYGLMDEIILPFMSVPKMLVMRSGEISLHNVPDNLKNLWHIILHRGDGLIWNTPEEYGAVYVMTLPYMFLGLGDTLYRTCRSFARREYSPAVLMLCQFIGAFILCLLINVNLNRMNIILIPLLFLEAMGINLVFRFGGRKIGAVILACYIVLFAGFENYYFTDYARRVSVDFSHGFEAALNAAPERNVVYISPDVHYPKLLFYKQIPPEEFNAGVEYNYYPAAYLSARRVGKYSFAPDLYAPEDDAVYIVRRGYDISAFEDFTAERYNDYYLLYK